MKTELTIGSSIERRSMGSEEYTRAMLNILEDFATEKRRLEETQRAVFNILNDFMEEKDRLEETHRAVLNILDDFAGEKNRLEDAQRAVLNILQDSSDEKAQLEEVQKAMLNLLEDFDVERMRTEAANSDLRDALESVRRAKEAADAANTELQAFSYSVSHDLRAPLRAMDGFSQALIEDYNDILDDSGKDYLRRVRTASQKMAQLIDALLKLSRLTRGELNLVPVNLSSLARGIASDLQRSNPDRSVKFRIADNITAKADTNLIKVVLENLLGNAWKFTSKNAAEIEFGVTTLDGVAVYYVKDNGAGFEMKYVDKLFGTFQRLHSETDFPGTGIGLSIILRIITRHGGSVCARGAPGKGATFYFSLDRPVLKDRCMDIAAAA
jgi:signal transduction histidine kinase